MPDPARSHPGRRRAGLLLTLASAATLAACSSTSPSPTASDATGSPTASHSPAPTASPVPTATPEPALSLELPADRDARQVDVSVAPDVAVDGDGQIVVTVTNDSDERITELVLRWATDLRDTLFLAPFKPSEQRVANGGPPLLQDWTKWVDGPGERGEPAGTTSLGWGPLDPGATLTIPILVTRRGPGDVSFDLQVLAGEAILTLADGGPAELRVDVP